jgi:hypothetical protein
MKLAVALRLARISLLPTVWTNVLAGIALGGGTWADPRLPLLVVALSLFYTGGMFLNDAFDREFDSRARPERPIPSGEVTARAVFSSGFGMIAIGWCALAIIGQKLSGTPTWAPAVGGLCLAGAIVLYDAYHKSNPLSPLVMGSCRMLVYMTAALAIVGSLGTDVVVGAVVLLCYLIGLTYAAKNEHLNRVDHAWPLGFLAVPLVYGAVRAFDQPLVLLPLAALTVWVWLAVRRLMRRGPGDVPRAVVSLLAGISLLDAMMLAGCGQIVLMLLAGGAFLLTLRLQRWVAGT